MDYLDVITLQDAKDYLRIDDTLTQDDRRISYMIKASLSIIEKRTNIIVFPRDITYSFTEYCLRVYDFPINTNTTITEDFGVITRELYSIFHGVNNSDKLTLNVGYENVDDIPSELIECALVYVDYLYNGNETSNSAKIPDYINEMIDNLKRFIM